MFSRLRRLMIGMSCMLMVAATQAQQVTPKKNTLPEPLTLEYALSLPQGQYPALQRVDANIQKALARKQLIGASDDVDFKLEGQLRWIDPPVVSSNQSSDDHRLGLIASKTLYDFGRQETQLSAANDDVESQRLSYQNAIEEHRIEVMRCYFDVLLADLQFSRYNEEMAVAYIQWDRMKQRRRLKQAIDVDVLKLETEYQKIRHLRYSSEAMQRQTRARLAAVLNHPGQLSSTLAQPNLTVLKNKLPEVEQLQHEALKNNLGLRVLRKELEAAQQRVLAARRAYGPMLTGKVEAFTYSRVVASSDAWRAGVTLDVPLYTGKRSSAAVAQAKANVYQIQAEVKEREYNITQAVLEAWLKIDTLRIQRQEMHTRANYADSALDQSRSLYELEIKADLGMSMVRVSEAEYLVKQTDYKMAIAWERLRLLTGQINTSPTTRETPMPGDQHE